MKTMKELFFPSKKGILKISTYGLIKIEVNGNNQAQLFKHLTATTGVDGHTGPIRWNFEKFLIDHKGNITRYASQVKPSDIIQ